MPTRHRRITGRVQVVADTSKGITGKIAALGVLREVSLGKEKLFVHPKPMQLLSRDSNAFPFYG
jgi:hypothetical protein